MLCRSTGAMTRETAVPVLVLLNDCVMRNRRLVVLRIALASIDLR